MTLRWRFLADILIRTLILLAAVNILFAWLDPMPALGSLSLYNRLFPGRSRLPFSAQPDLSYNLSLYNLDAMFASQKIAAGPKPADEFRVILIGDSSTWGALLAPAETRTALMNADSLAADGKRVRFYNLGYPTISLFKDLMLLQRAMQYQPDMVIWTVTLEAMPADKQLFTPIIQHNPSEARGLIAAYGLTDDPRDPSFVDSTFWDRTIFGRRRDLADLIRLQVYGFDWNATGVDAYLPTEYERPANDLPDDRTFHELAGPDLQTYDLAWDVLDAGRRMAGKIPLLIVNEPIFVADGAHGDIRYNSLYPRWAYDAYRRQMDTFTSDRGLAYLDLWDSIPAMEFTNSSIHLSPAAEGVVAQRYEAAVRKILAESPGRP